MSFWLIPLGAAAAGVLVLSVVTTRVAGMVKPTTSSIARVRHDLTPLLAALRREMSRAAGQRRPGGSGPRQ